MISPQREDQGRELILLLFGNHTSPMTTDARRSSHLIILSLISSVSCRTKFLLVVLVGIVACHTEGPVPKGVPTCAGGGMETQVSRPQVS